MKKTTIASLIGLAISTQAFAGTNIQADDVVVTASRVHDNIQNIPANVQVITREEINELNPNSIPQILSQLGGLNITGVALGQFNRGAVVDIGGYGATASSTTLVLINGQRISPIDSAAVPWEIIPVGAIDRIEIIKGGASVLYGDRAVGGVINIVTNESQKSINQASITAGSFGTIGTNAIFQNKYNDTLFKVSGSANHSDGWRQNSASDQYSLDARITQYFDKGSVYLEAFGNQNKNETPGAALLGDANVNRSNPKSVKCDFYTCFIGAYNKYDNYGVGFGNLYEMTNRVKFESNVSYKGTQSDFNEPWGNNYSGLTPTGRSSYTPYSSKYDRWRLDFSPRFKIDLGEFGNLVTGYDYSHASGSQEDINLDKARASLLDNSLYFNHRVTVKNDLDFIAGFRRQIENITAYDLNYGSTTNRQKTTSANAWEFGLNYRFSDTNKAYVKYGQSFRFPNIDEFWGYSSSGRTFFGGIIIPQLDRTAEIGSSFILGNTKFTTSLFHTKTEHEIRYNVLSGTNMNDTNTTERKGVHLSTATLLSERLSLHTNSKLQKAIYSDGEHEGRSLDLVPHLLVNARLNYKLENDWSLGVVSNYAGSQYYVGSNDLASQYGEYKKMPSYIVTDLYANKKLGNWNLNLTVKNVTNERYSTFGGLNKQTNYAYSGYYYYPSDPRSVFASVSYNF